MAGSGPTYGAVDELSADLRRDLADWLLCLADNKRLLGVRYAGWCTGAPELEADIAVSAMAQYELGHARLLRGVLGNLEEDPREEVRRASDPGGWCSLPILDRPLAGWPELVVVNALVDSLLTVNLEAAHEGGLEPLAQRLRKAISEEKYHFVHARAWFERLLDGPDELVARLDDSVQAVWAQCVAWWGPAEDNALDRLGAAGVLAAPARELRDRWLEDTAPLFGGSIRVPARPTDDGWCVELDVDWKDWSPSSRRHGTPEYDDESFALITGAHARALGMED